MKNLFNLKKVMLTGLLAAVLALPFLFATNTEVKASGSPRFNYLQGDVEMLRGATRSNLSWRDPVDVKTGEDISVLFYFHNGVVNSTATNTKLRVDVPTVYSQNHFLKGYHWSDQTSAITSTVVNGKTIGREGLTLNMSEEGKLEYVSGSTKIFVNGSQVGTPVADGITTSNGLSIGNVNGCWEYAGYVTFTLRSLPREIKIPNVTVSKKVRNVNLNGTAFVEENTAYAGDTLEYLIEYQNIGNGEATNAIVRDVLPANVSYIAGSTRHARFNGGETVISDGITIDGITISIPALEKGYIKFKVKISQNIAANEVLVNTAHIGFSKTSVSDTAKTKIVAHNQPVDPTTPSTPEGDLPVTGAENFFIALFVAINGIIFKRYFKQLKSYKKLLS